MFMLTLCGSFYIMTIKELVDALSKYPSDWEVSLNPYIFIKSGFCYSPVDDVDEESLGGGIYVKSIDD